MIYYVTKKMLWLEILKVNDHRLYVLFPEFGRPQAASLHLQNYKSEQQFCEQ